MIYLGVTISYDYFHIVALDNEFNFLAKHNVKFKHAYHITTWINLLKSDSCELTKWYFDELDFNYKTYPQNAIKKFDRLHKIYLVNHRKLIETSNIFSCYACYQYKKATNVDTAFVLAAAEKIIDHNFIHYYSDDYMDSLFKMPV